MNRRCADLQGCGGFIQSDLSSLRAFALSVGRAIACWLRKWQTRARVQLLTPSRRLAGPVEDRRDRVVVHPACEDTHEIDDVR